MWRRAVSVLVLFFLAGPGILAQAPADEQTTTIRTTTREVILDIIVRDKHHHALADVHPEEVQVFEDGVKQKINAFRNVEGAEQLQTERALAKSSSPSPSSGTPKASATNLRELNFVSVVFAQIAPLNLEFAREAVLDFLKSDNLPNTYVTIYRLDPALHVVQPYTTDKTSLISAVNAAAKGISTKSDLGVSAQAASSSNAAIQAAGTNILASPLTTPQQALAVNAAMQDPLPGIATDPLWARNAASMDVSVALGAALLAQAHLATGLRFAESLSNGMDAMDALRELVRVQSKLPGRKVVLYLADGLPLPMDRRDIVNSVISYANQKEVAFYAVDTRGLSADDPLAQSLADQQRAGAESSANRSSARIGHMEDDDVQLAATSNKQLAMQELAESTGGFAVTNTNQIAQPMERVMEDIRTHYEVAYTPTASNYDGHFRKIEVRIDRPHVTVQTRSGYFALPEMNGQPLQPFEVAALHAINARPLPVDFPYDAALLRFRPKGAAVEHEMAFDVPVSSLRMVPDASTGKERIRVSVVAFIHKDNGEVVGRVSRDLMREVSKEDLSRLSNDHILYAEPIELPGGHYIIDTVVTDELGEKTTVKRISTFVDAGKDFGVSSLELVRGIQPLGETHDSQNPFETDSGRIVPTLSDSMPSGKPIDVFFVVYPRPASEIAPKITLQLFRDGEEVGVKDLAPPKPRPDGSMHCLLQIKPGPGQYDMIITAQQGTLTSEARLSVKVTPNAGANE